MATLEGKKIVIIGGSSGIGYSVAKTSLLNLAEHVLVASSSQAKVDAAVKRLLAEPALQAQSPNGRISGDVVDLQDTQGIAALFEKIGEIDHLIITSGSVSQTIDFRTEDLSKHKGALRPHIAYAFRNGTNRHRFVDAFDVRFWGAAVAAQKAKIRAGGSITFTVGMKSRRSAGRS